MAFKIPLEYMKLKQSTHRESNTYSDMFLRDVNS